MNYKEKEIANFPGYTIDTDGNVWSRKNNKWGLRKEYKRLKLWFSHGYPHVSLYKDGKSYKKKVHHLVLETFIRLRNENEETRHLDGNRKNNSLSNLAWGTAFENGQDRIRHDTRHYGIESPIAKLNEIQVRIIKKYPEKNCMNIYRFLSKIFCVSWSTIRAIRTGYNWRHI